MLVTLEEAKNYLRVDTVDDDRLIETILSAAHQMSMDILRTDDPVVLEQEADAKVAVLYATAYLYEHREEADHKALVLSLRMQSGTTRMYGRIIIPVQLRSVEKAVRKYTAPGKPWNPLIFILRFGIVVKPGE